MPLPNLAVDRHADVELSLVLTGDAEVEVGGVVTRVNQGSGFLLESSEAHVVHNRSASETLQIFSAYWLPDDVPPGDGPDV